MKTACDECLAVVVRLLMATIFISAATIIMLD